MRKIIKNERILYLILQFLALLFGISVAILLAVLPTCVICRILSEVPEAQHYTPEFCSAFFGTVIVAIILGLITTILGTTIAWCDFKATFLDFEQEVAVTRAHYRHRSLQVNFWLGFGLTLMAIVAICLLVSSGRIMIPNFGFSHLSSLLNSYALFFHICLIGSMAMELLITISSALITESLRKCYENLGFKLQKAPDEPVASEA